MSMFTRAAPAFGSDFLDAASDESITLLPVKFEIYLLLALLIFGIFKTHRTVVRSQSTPERFFAIRASAFTWLVGIILVSGFLFLPGRMRVLFLLPAFFIVTSLLKFWRHGRTRLQAQDPGRVDLEHMKRVN